MSNLACRCAQRANASCVQVLDIILLDSWAWICRTVELFQASRCVGVDGLFPLCMTFDLREQAVSVNERDYLGGLGRTVGLRDRLQGGER